MFSTEGDGELTSPPRKRTRTLDIADVACLVRTRQSAVLASPEEPSTSSSFHRATTTVEETPDEFSQELIEEDTVIQSSLPQYLSHVYGSFAIGSCSGANGTVSTTAGSSKLHSPFIAESQGFIVADVSDQLKISISNNKHTPSEAKPESSTQYSPLLFDSPTTSLTKSSPAQTSGLPTFHPSPTSGGQQPPVSLPQNNTAETNSNCLPSKSAVVENNKKGPSRKRKLSATKTEKLQYTCPPSCVSLADCTAKKPESLVSILVLILQVNSLMDVACKKGPLAGSTVAMASLLVTDPTRSCMKLLLWREAACWAERIVAGDIIFFKSIRLKRWRGETVGHTIMYSKVLNLHQPKKTLPQKFVEMIPAESLDVLMEWGKTRHGYLFRDSHPLPSSQRPIHFRSSDELGVESVIHFRAKLTSIISERVFLFSDRPGKDVFLYLLSSSRLGGGWYRELREGVGEVWELQYLSVSLEGTQGSFSLQVTTRSQLRKLCSDSSHAQAILKLFPSPSLIDSISAVESISTLLESKSSGIKKCRAKATKLSFQLEAGGVLSLDQLAELGGAELVSHLLQAVYVGCEACTTPLRQDENCVYNPCEECKQKTPGGNFTSAYCYRPLVVRLTDSSATLDVIANQVTVSKLMGGLEAAELFRMNLSQKESKREALQEAVGRLLSSGEKDCWILNTVFAVDEFSFVESLIVSLVDWTPSDHDPQY